MFSADFVFYTVDFGVPRDLTSQGGLIAEFYFNVHTYKWASNIKKMSSQVEARIETDLKAW
jgi:hypothetical protein